MTSAEEGAIRVPTGTENHRMTHKNSRSLTAKASHCWAESEQPIHTGRIGRSRFGKLQNAFGFIVQCRGRPLIATIERRSQRHFCDHFDGATSADSVVQLRAVSRRYGDRNCSSRKCGGLNDRSWKWEVAKPPPGAALLSHFLGLNEAS